MQIDVIHGILWSKYKAGVFSEMYRLAHEYGVSIHFYQVAESDTDRMMLSGVDVSYHRYPYVLLFEGAYSRISRWKLVPTLFWRVYRSNADLILLPGFSELSHWGMLAGAILSGKKRAVVSDSTLRDRRQSRLKGVFKRLFFRLCSGYFTYGQRGREYLLHYGATKGRIFQRVQAAALPTEYSEDEVLERRNATLLDPTAPIFLFVGRLSEQKSLDTLLEAFKIVSSRIPGAKLRLVGGGQLEGFLRDLSHKLCIADRVEFVGGLDLDKLSDEYAGATCLVLPSRCEPWGLVVNEALHFGCPVVVSDNCGCVPELIVDGVTGLVFSTDNIQELAKKLLDAVSVFSNGSKTAKACLGVISDYLPERSARQTMAGCLEILKA